MPTLHTIAVNNTHWKFHSRPINIYMPQDLGSHNYCKLYPWNFLFSSLLVVKCSFLIEFVHESSLHRNAPPRFLTLLLWNLFLLYHFKSTHICRSYVCSPFCVQTLILWKWLPCLNPVEVPVIPLLECVKPDSLSCASIPFLPLLNSPPKSHSLSGTTNG